MRRLLPALLISIALPASSALADAMPDCPPGQHMEENPVQPGAMHHSGGRCVDDPGGCAIDPGTRSSAPTWIALAGIALAIRAGLRRRA